MKISGFTFVRNAVKFDYPVVESITSILPIVDEFIVNVGVSDDGTRKLITDIASPKIKIIDSVWDARFTVQSRIFAVQTNIALYQCSGDWCFYIQADEVFHPDGLKPLKEMLLSLQDNNMVHGLLLDYLHFFGGYQWVANSHRWYRKEIRIIRNFQGISSFRDAQGFRIDGKKLKAVDSQLKMHHYGWARPPEIMGAKKNYHDSLHHGANREDKNEANNFDYSNYIDPKAVSLFTGTHPPQMQARVKNCNINFDPNKIAYKTKGKDIKYRSIDFIGKLTGWFPGEYKNYKKIVVK